MNYNKIVLIISTASIMFSSCFGIDDCDGILTEQLFKYGEHEIRINSPNDTLSIGDSIRFRIKTPKFILDSSNLNQFQIEEIKITFRVTRDTNEPKDTALIYIFDQYFDIVLNEGEMVNPYLFIPEENSQNFSLDFYYVCKKQLKYYIPIQFDNIVVRNIDVECMSGDTQTWSASISIESDHNSFQNQNSLKNYFGFVVK